MKQLFILILIFYSYSTFAQHRVSGNVKDLSGPLPGVSIIVKGTTNGTITDLDGNYSLEVAPTATLVFSFVGYKMQTISVAGRSSLDVTLTESKSLFFFASYIGVSTHIFTDLNSAYYETIETGGISLTGGLWYRRFNLEVDLALNDFDTYIGATLSRRFQLYRSLSIVPALGCHHFIDFGVDANLHLNFYLWRVFIYGGVNTDFITARYDKDGDGTTDSETLQPVWFAAGLRYTPIRKIKVLRNISFYSDIEAPINEDAYVHYRVGIRYTF